MAADPIPPAARPLPSLRAPRWAQALLAAVFLGAVGYACAETFFGGHVHRTISLSEKRLLAPPPGWPHDLGSLEAFPLRCEAWMNDHFFQRDWLVGCYSFLQIRLLGRSPRPDVIIGGHDWLYYNVGGTLDDYRGMLRYSPDEIDFMRAYLAARSNWFARHGIAYVFAVAPDKHTVYPEYLPAYLRHKRRSGTELDQFLEATSHGDNVAPPLPVLDLRPALLQARQDYHLFLRTDTHWNQTGGRVGAGAIREWLQRQTPLPLGPLSQGPPHEVDEPGGDLSAELGLSRVLRERIPRWPVSAGIVRPPWLQPGLESWWPGSALFVNQDDTGNLRAVFLHDSFADSMKASLAEACDRALFLPRTPTMHHASFAQMRRLVDDYHPDVVVEEVIERNLGGYFFGDPTTSGEMRHYLEDP